MAANLKVLFLSSEVVPFAKTGGLADVAGSLPIALKRQGVDVRIVLPFYRSVREGNFTIKPKQMEVSVPFGEIRLIAKLMETTLGDDIPVYLLEREDLYDRPHLYGDALGDYYDNLERFSFFSHASLKLTSALGFTPDVIHCHDWQTGLVPALIKSSHGTSQGLSKAKTVFTIHNIGYAGIFPAEKIAITGLAQTDFFHPEGFEYWGNISLLKSGIVYSDAITTVSPTYAQEIQTPVYGMGMEGILRARGSFLHGILNGIDYDQWDPAKDPHISAPYSPQKMGGKVQCKASLIRAMHLEPSLGTRPLFGVISRLDAQKGLDILIKIIDEVLSWDIGLVILGSGNKRIQTTLYNAAKRHTGKMGVYFGFNEPLAHQIMAGADCFIMPSRYEPCGLTQMYALKYGTVPLVRATGGLKDTVMQFDPKTKKGNGLKFRPYNAAALLNTIKKAIALFGKPQIWKRIMRNGMAEDFSWERSARQYVALYQSIIEKIGSSPNELK